MRFLPVALLIKFFIQTWARISDDLYIIIENTEVNSCRGTQNRVFIASRDVVIEKTNGDPVSFIRAPGTYRIHFRKISLQEDFPYLSGEISALLEVPFASDRILRYDAPYSVIPEQTTFGEKCDEDSGVVKRRDGPGRTKIISLCRYCNLYYVKDKVENRLNRQHRYLPSPNRFERRGGFTQIGRRSYEVTKYIDLPSKSKLEADVRRIKPNEKETEKRLRKGIVSGIILGIMCYEDVNTHQIELYAGELFTLITAVFSLVLTFLACLGLAAPKSQFFQKMVPTVKIAWFTFVLLLLMWLAAGSVEIWHTIELKLNMRPDIMRMTKRTQSERFDLHKRYQIRAALAGLSFTNVLFYVGSLHLTAMTAPYSPVTSV